MTNVEGMTKFEDHNVRQEDSFWNECAETMVREQPQAKRVYDLEERTARFGEAVIDFAKAIPQDAVTNRIISQIVGSATSVGFLKSIGTCKKETREVKHFLRMAGRAAPELKPEARKLWLEARQLHLIFSKIWRTGKNEQRNPNNK